MSSPNSDNWPEIFALAKVSGLSEVGYCRENGIKYSSFCYQKKRLSRGAEQVVSFGGSSVKVTVSGILLEFGSDSDPVWSAKCIASLATVKSTAKFTAKSTFK